LNGYHYYKTNEAKKWIFLEYDRAEECLALASVPFQIELADLYDKVNFATEEQA
jgi:hypothetical protein